MWWIHGLCDGFPVPDLPEVRAPQVPSYLSHKGLRLSLHLMARPEIPGNLEDRGDLRPNHAKSANG